jgi:hypothetical protein
MTFNRTPIDEVESAGEARDIAIAWQHSMSEQSMSWGEVAEYQDYFETLANKFDLVDEFRENGII